MTLEALRRRWCIIVARTIWAAGDTAPVRLLLAWSSGVYAMTLGINTWQGNLLFDRPAYALMDLVHIGSLRGEWLWVFIFTLHWVGVHWRILDPKERVWAGILVNFYGFVIWFYSTLSINLSLGLLLPTSSTEWVLIVASGWALYRTGLRREMVTA
jgi:hypothetical protein